MPVNYHQQIARLERELAGLDRDAAAAAKKAAELISRANGAREAVGSSPNPITIRLQLRELEQATRALAAARKKQSDIWARRSKKFEQLLVYRNRL